MSQLTDIVVLMLVLGVAYELFKSGKLNEIFGSLQNAIPAPAPAPAPEAGGTETPTAEGAQPAAGGGDLGCGFTVRPMESDPNRFRTDDAQGKEVSGGKVYLSSKEEQEKWSREECAKRGGGGGGTTEPAAAEQQPATESGGSEDSGGGDKKKKKSNYARSCLDYVPLNWT